MNKKAPIHCANCGKPGHKVVTHVYNPHFIGLVGDLKPTDSDIYSWRYKGDGVILKTEYHSPDGDKKHIVKVSLWDGESWMLSRAPFCTIQCAEGFALGAYTAGFRRHHEGE